MPEEREIRKIYKRKLTASRPVGRPRIRWMDNVMEDIQGMNIVKWKRCAQDRNRWKSIVEQAKTHIEMWRIVNKYGSAIIITIIAVNISLIIKTRLKISVA
jgi:hypothetical protein